ncbi:MAG: bifunctional nuclease domain-containing protein [Spirosomataceae bacterium]
MEKIKLEISDLNQSQPRNGSYVLILREDNGYRQVPIIIGTPEAHAIAWELDRVPMARPMTHDLFKSFARAFDYTVEEIIISDFREGVFYAQIICTDGIRQKSIDARPSDAVAIALRFDVPIYIHEKVMKEVGIEPEEIDRASEEELEEEEFTVPSPKQPANKLASISTEELKRLLDEALAQENYEEAAQIRDELDRRT